MSGDRAIVMNQQNESTKAKIINRFRVQMSFEREQMNKKRSFWNFFSALFLCVNSLIDSSGFLDSSSMCNPSTHHSIIACKKKKQLNRKFSAHVEIEISIANICGSAEFVWRRCLLRYEVQKWNVNWDDLRIRSRLASVFIGFSLVCEFVKGRALRKLWICQKIED